MSVILQRTDPLSAASDAVGSFYDAKRKKQVEDAAEQAAQQQSARDQANKDRQYQIEQGKYSLEQQKFGLDQNKDQREQIAADAKRKKDAFDLAQQQEKAKYDQQMRALLLEQKRLENKKTSGQIITQGDVAKLAHVNYLIKQTDATYEGTLKQLAVAKQQAEITETQARTNRIEHPIVRSSNGSHHVGQKNATQPDASNLSPQGLQFLDMLNSTNNPPTRLQALAAVKKSALPDEDKKAIMGLVMSPKINFETSRQQVNDEKPPKDTSHIQEYNAIAKGKLFDTLTPRLRDVVRHWMVDSKLSVNDIISSLPTSQVSDPDKQAISRALGAQ